MTRPNLNPRGESVLRTLIETYLEAGEPVGSRLLAKRYPESLSSATIRNVLSDLEDEAYVAQPHTSAGRIPTELAYRYYVDRWLNAQPPGPEIAERLSAALEGVDLDAGPSEPLSFEEWDGELEARLEAEWAKGE